MEVLGGNSDGDGAGVQRVRLTTYLGIRSLIGVFIMMTLFWLLPSVDLGQRMAQGGRDGQGSSVVLVWYTVHHTDQDERSSTTCNCCYV